jgi:UDP-N-acetylglucosamine:LPS N-acetylglucosamine transferase
MAQQVYVLITDRGGHLHNALKLVSQINRKPDCIVTTHGPDIDSLRSQYDRVFEVPYLFRWFGKKRWFNPLGALHHVFVSFCLSIKIRPKKVISLGASNVVCFCYFSRLLGAKIIHVECMNQVKTKSITGKLLYPICQDLFVQWPELLKVYGPKARYEGWVL